MYIYKNIYIYIYTYIFLKNKKKTQRKKIIKRYTKKFISYKKKY